MGRRRSRGGRGGGGGKIIETNRVFFQERGCGYFVAAVEGESLVADWF